MKAVESCMQQFSLQNTWRTAKPSLMTEGHMPEQYIWQHEMGSIHYIEVHRLGSNSMHKWFSYFDEQS